MNDNQAGIEALGDHEYLIRVAQDDDLVTIEMRANPEVVDRIAGPDADEARVVATTVDYLIARQRPDELPGQLDLDDVMAAYDDYLSELQNEFANAR
ncbi:hypothetical protein [Mycobacterium bourgelatii]|uniref:Uncharacterized protein n=1 Tax=Mycobacterium bourgelatii TaxID=1273442 RepID=A0A7I9YII3_MYCBU|nr:hypothetical protein [Mycobacterium bourgelatii]MCV6978013.1 hypothetical protein [Mycobacterium bourgelatii]GFG88419.1 hypothetical protein MBOU_04610 [Mycobacterium bourgelatii]